MRVIITHELRTIAALAYKLIVWRSLRARPGSDGLSRRGGRLLFNHGLGLRVRTLETDLVEGGVVTKKPTTPEDTPEDTREQKGGHHPDPAV